MPVDAPLYPANLIVRGRRCLVVGGGRVALAKVRGLLDAEADVTVVAPHVDEALGALPVTIERRPYAAGEAAAYRLVVTATGDPAVDGQVYADADAAGVWVNAADDPAHCSFTLPARIRRGDLLVTVSTGGRSPALASWLRARLETTFGPEHEALLDLLAEVRDARQAGGEASDPASWHRALDSGMLDLIREGRLAEARELLQACLSSSSD